MDNNRRNTLAANPIRSLVDLAHGVHTRASFLPQPSLAADLNCCC
jgi:hypothetical protein